jgi:hypothetical protein
LPGEPLCVFASLRGKKSMLNSNGKTKSIRYLAIKLSKAPGAKNEKQITIFISPFFAFFARLVTRAQSARI